MFGISILLEDSPAKSLGGVSSNKSSQKFLAISSVADRSEGIINYCSLVVLHRALERALNRPLS